MGALQKGISIRIEEKKNSKQQDGHPILYNLIPSWFSRGR